MLFFSEIMISSGCCDSCFFFCGSILKSCVSSSDEMVLVGFISYEINFEYDFVSDVFNVVSEVVFFCFKMMVDDFEFFKCFGKGIYGIVLFVKEKVIGCFFV